MKRHLWPQEWFLSYHRSYQSAQTITLPTTTVAGGGSVGHLMKHYQNTPALFNNSFSLRTLSEILNTSFGIRKNTRSYPSESDLYPLEIYINAVGFSEINDGVYHYNCKEHALETVAGKEVAQNIHACVHTSKQAPITILVVAVWERIAQKYQDFGYPMVFIEAGHAIQNVHLLCAEYNLLCKSFTHFDAPSIEHILQFDTAQSPENIIYITGICGR